MYIYTFVYIKIIMYIYTFVYIKIIMYIYTFVYIKTNDFQVSEGVRKKTRPPDKSVDNNTTSELEFSSTDTRADPDTDFEPGIIEDQIIVNLLHKSLRVLLMEMFLS